MLAFLAVATGLLVASVTIGAGLLRMVYGHAGGPEREADRALSAAFTGLLFLAWLLLVAATFLPLSPSVLLAVAAVGAPVVLAHEGARGELRRWTRAPASWAIAAFSIFAAGLITLRPVTLYDTGLYHYQSIRWLAEHGNVPGLALLHRRFGFVSSWFALHAPLDTGPLAGRSLTVVSGLTVALVLALMIVSGWRLITLQAQLADIMLLVGAGTWLLLVHWLRLSSSASPDLPASVLPLLIAWMLLVPCSAGTGTARLKRPGGPWLLAALGMAVKLSALPLLLTTAVWQLWLDRSARRIPPMAWAAALVGLPLIGVYVVITGCPAFPSGLFCLESSTSVPVHVADRTAIEVTQWARWSEPTPSDATGLDWIGHWIATERLTVALLMLWALAVTAAMAVAAVGRWIPERERVAVGLAAGSSIVGVSFTMLTGPSLRFVLGPMVLGWAVGLAIAVWRLSASLQRTGLIVGGSASSHLSLLSTRGLRHR